MHDVLYVLEAVFREIELGGGGGAFDLVWPPRAMLHAVMHPMLEVAKTCNIHSKPRDGERIGVVWA